MKGEKKIKPSLKSEVAMTFYKSLRISLGQLLTCAEDAPAHSNKCIFQSNFPMRFLIESIVKENYSSLTAGDFHRFHIRLILFRTWLTLNISLSFLI